MLNMVAPLPIFLAGLMQGWLFSLVAGLVAGAITLAVGGPVTAAIFCGIAAVPATVLVRQALLAQQTAEGDLEWYPVQRLGLVLAGIGGVLGLGAMALLEAETVAGVVDQAIGMVNTQGQLPQEVTASIRQALIAAVPGFFAASAVLSLVLNGAVAQRIAERTGRAVRPQMRLTEFRLPASVALGFGAAMLLSGLLGGTVGQIAVIVAMVLGLLFTCEGLIVAHLFARNSGGVPMLAGLYIAGLAMLFLLGPVLPFILMLLGIADAFFGLRGGRSGGMQT